MKRIGPVMRSHFRLAGALLIGVVLGTVPSCIYQRQRQDAFQQTFKVLGNGLIREMYLSQISESVNTLTALRQGKIDDLIDTKEDDLSRSIHNLIVAVQEDILSNTNHIRTLKAAARYRSEHAYKTGDAEKDEAVEDILKRALAGETDGGHG